MESQVKSHVKLTEGTITLEQYLNEYLNEKRFKANPKIYV